MVRMSLLLVGIIILGMGALLAVSNFGLLPFELPLPAEVNLGGMTLPMVAVGGIIAIVGVIITIMGMKMY